MTQVANHVSAANFEVVKWTILDMCKDVCVDYMIRIELAMQLFTYESEMIETYMFLFLMKKNDEKIESAIAESSIF